MAENNNELAIDTEALKRDIDTIEQSIHELKKKDEKMTEEIVALGNMWKGSANRAFSFQFATDCVKLNMIFEFLEEYKVKLSEAMTEYIKCDDKVRDAVNNIIV